MAIRLRFLQIRGKRKLATKGTNKKIKFLIRGCSGYYVAGLLVLSRFFRAGHDLKDGGLSLDHLFCHDNIFDLLFGRKNVH